MLVVLFALLATLNITSMLFLIQNSVQGKAHNTWAYHISYFRNACIYGDSLTWVLCM